MMMSEVFRTGAETREMARQQRAALDEMSPSERRAFVRERCQDEIAYYRERRNGRRVASATYSLAPSERDESPRGLLVEARDMHLDLRAAVEQGRHLLVVAEGAIEAGETVRARQIVALVDECFGQVRELCEQQHGVLGEADALMFREEHERWLRTLRPVVVADRFGVHFPQRLPSGAAS